MVLKDVSYLKRGNYVYMYGHWLNMELSQEFDTPYWKIFTKNDFFLKLGFRKEDNYYKLYIPYGRSYEYSAFYKYCYCKYQGGKYTPNTVVSDGNIILFPDLETQTCLLGFLDNGDHYIEIPYKKFIEEVTDIWEERTPIEGFKFDTEPIVYLKKDGVWLKEPKEQ